jgi:hypothetical protein
LVPPDILDDNMCALLHAHKAELLAALAEQGQGEDEKEDSPLPAETVKRRKGPAAEDLSTRDGAVAETFSPPLSPPFHPKQYENSADAVTPTTLPPVHDAHDPHAEPSAPCAACGGVAWRAESRDWRWQWVCGQCQPVVSGSDAPRPRTAAELIATLPQAPCPGGCGRQTAYGWECLSCRLAERGGAQ